MQQTIVLASQNSGKIAEFQQILASQQLRIVPQDECHVPEAAETGLSFIENAILKARNACEHSGLPAIADDSGLCVDYLQGAPGIYSARYADQNVNGSNANFSANIEKLLKNLHEVPEEKRQAHFYCVIAFLRHAKDPEPLICQGRWTGRILNTPAGEHGFGYDPIFYVPTHACSAAELSQKIKNQISHRALALTQFIQAIKFL
jgi:XTP/dITP diphosphohydrolase